MKYGMNLLLWTTNVEPSHDPIFDMLKECGYDGVEVPIFQMEEASYQRLAKRLDAVKLDRTTVCCVARRPIRSRRTPPSARPRSLISSGPSICPASAARN